MPSSYVRNGHVVTQRSLLEELLQLPHQIYALLAFFLKTLVDPTATKPNAARDPHKKRGGFGATDSGGGGGGGGNGGGGSGGGGAPRNRRPIGRVGAGTSSISGAGG